MAMMIVLPREKNGLTLLEKQLTPTWLREQIKNAQRREVIVALPKFKITSTLSLSKMLAAMGMTDAFGMKADFSGMTDNKELFISDVVHKAFVDVNETGTEAAAATAVEMALLAMPKPKPQFRADHPFIFIIRDNATGSILFMGRLENPTL